MSVWGIDGFDAHGRSMQKHGHDMVTATETVVLVGRLVIFGSVPRLRQSLRIFGTELRKRQIGRGPTEQGHHNKPGEETSAQAQHRRDKHS